MQPTRTTRTTHFTCSKIVLEIRVVPRGILVYQPGESPALLTIGQRVSPSDPTLCRREAPTPEPGDSADAGVFIVRTLASVGKNTVHLYTAAACVVLRWAPSPLLPTHRFPAFLSNHASVFVMYVIAPHPANRMIQSGLRAGYAPHPYNMAADEYAKQLKARANALFREGDHRGAVNTFRLAIEAVHQVWRTGFECVHPVLTVHTIIVSTIRVHVLQWIHDMALPLFRLRGSWVRCNEL